MRPELGLELAGEHRPDLILLDLHLPDMPGETVLRRLQTNPKTAGIPVVVLSADAHPALLQRLLEQGVRSFLTKPWPSRSCSRCSTPSPPSASRPPPGRGGQGPGGRGARTRLRFATVTLPC